MDEKLDIREKGGVRNGQQQILDRRLFMQLLAFGNCRDVAALTDELKETGLPLVIYRDVNDPRGIALLSWHECADYFVGTFHPALERTAVAELMPKPEFTMLGRTYALGHEPDLEDWLLHKPARTVCEPTTPWAVWYPLRRSGAFSALSAEEQAPILREHGRIGHAFGTADLAHDVRLACFGIDQHDNDFVIGLIGRDLYPLSACVQAMRKTQQTSNYIQQMGPFFVGKVVYQSAIQ